MKNYFDLNQRVFIITGGAGLLGIKHAEAIIENNGIPVLFDIKRDVEEKAKYISTKYNKKCLGYVADITDIESVITSVKKVISETGSIYGLINNAAYDPKVEKKGVNKDSRFETFTVERWNMDINVGLTGAFIISQAVTPYMVKDGGGVIINISSDLGVIAPDQRLYSVRGLNPGDQPTKPITYSVVKHGIIGLTKYLATYWAGSNIRVNSLSPGGVQTEGLDKEFVERIKKLIPMNRMATTDEYKGVLVFLCSDASKYMTGANLIVDGGRTIW